jgi:hypothetical protein
VIKVKRIAHSVRPSGDLRDIPGKYNMLTSFLAAFHLDERRRSCDIRHWNHFLAYARRDVLVPGGTLFLNLASGKITAPVWDALDSFAKWFEDEPKSLYFSSLEAFDDDCLVAPRRASARAARTGRSRKAAGRRIEAM